MKRQAGAARRYQQKEGEYRELLERVLLGRYLALASRLADLKAGVEAATAREAEMLAELHRDDAELAAGRERLEALARAVADRERRQAELAATIEGRQEFIKGNRQRLQELGEQAAQGRALAERRGQEVERFAETLIELEGRRAELAGERDQAAAAVDDDEQRIAAAERDLRQVAARVESLRSELLAAAAEINAARNRAHQAQIELEKGNYRRHRLEEEAEQHAAELAQAAEAVELAREKVAGLDGTLAERAAEQGKVQAALEATMRREAEASEAKRQLEGEISGARQRQRILAELSRAHAQRRAALEQALAAAGVEPRYLASQAQAVEGWERSLDVFLGSLADAVVLEAEASPLALARALAGGSTGASLLARRDPQQVAEALPAIDDPAIVLSLGEALALPEDVAAALPPAFLVRDAADAERLARRHPGLAFLSREGVWVEAGTFHVDGEVATPGVLERERDLATLGRRDPAASRSQLEEATASLERLVAERATLARDSQPPRRARSPSSARSWPWPAPARRTPPPATAASPPRARRLRPSSEEIGREIERVAERRPLSPASSPRPRAATSSSRRASTAPRPRSMRRRRRARACAPRAPAAVAGWSSRGAAGVARPRHARACARRSMGAAVRSAPGGRRPARLGGRRAEIEAAVEKAEAELQAALEARAAAQDDALDEAGAARPPAPRDARARGAHRGAARAARRRALRGRGAARLPGGLAAGRRAPAPHLRRGVRPRGAGESGGGGRRGAGDDAWPRRAGGGASAHQGDARAARAGQRPRRPGARRAGGAPDVPHHPARRRGRLGREPEEDDQGDQPGVERALRARPSRRSTRHFGEIFARLFRGGEAEMRLLDEDDVLESGIEIVARPPGKRPQNLMLLSGGEKALTAIALLFALFRTKPSPFCILDEVDAPLDDVNTPRFVDLLKEMARDTQFIVITHNKLTMEVAASLYGVTMEEKGVSKLVSVQIDEVQPEERQAATA